MSEMEADIASYQPAQYGDTEIIDLRNAAYGPKGYKQRNKRKLDELEQREGSVLISEPGEGSQIAVQPLSKRTKINTVGVGKASGRPWKVAGERAGSLRNPILSETWEKKMKLKAQRDSFKAVKDQAIAAHKEKLAKARKQRQDAKARKEENRKKSNVTQVIKSNATLRKMMKSKKQRKLLQKADTLEE